MLGLASGTPCDGTFTNDEPTNHFTADCTGVTTFKALCALTITAVGYSGGRVSCTADGTYQTIQATDTNGCALDTDGCGGDTNALCSNDAPNARTCTCTNGFYGTTTLSDTQSFPGCVQDGICRFFFDDHFMLAATGGQNRLTSSCSMTDSMEVPVGKNLFIKKDSSATDEIIIDRGGTAELVASCNNGVNGGTCHFEHFRVTGGKINVHHVTLTGGYSGHNNNMLATVNIYDTPGSRLSGNVFSHFVSVLFKSNFGGHVEIKKGPVNFVDSTFAGSPSSGNGGSAVIIRGHSSVAFKQCLWSKNTGASYGAALYMMSGETTLDDCTFQDNSALTAGGAIRIDDYRTWQERQDGATSTKVLMVGSLFQNNMANGVPNVFNIADKSPGEIGDNSLTIINTNPLSQSYTILCANMGNGCQLSSKVVTSCDAMAPCNADELKRSFGAPFTDLATSCSFQNNHAPSIQCVYPSSPSPSPSSVPASSSSVPASPSSSASSSSSVPGNSNSSPSSASSSSVPGNSNSSPSSVSSSSVPDNSNSNPSKTPSSSDDTSINKISVDDVLDVGATSASSKWWMSWCIIVVNAVMLLAGF